MYVFNIWIFTFFTNINLCHLTPCKDKTSSTIKSVKILQKFHTLIYINDFFSIGINQIINFVD